MTSKFERDKVYKTEWGILTASGAFDVWDDEATVRKYVSRNPIAPGARLAKRVTTFED